jgi:ATP-dependent RNA helicase DHX37/DHR1
MWISKAAADQRAGRAGRTGPGHCYRLYSSSVYSRYLDEFALPEVLTRPLEDVVLAMKTMNISSVENFPFPTTPQRSQIAAAVRLLANLGCIDISRSDEDGSDGKITMLGAAVAKLPLGVRYGKMLLVSAQANVLDYGITLVAVLSESNPFIYATEEISSDDKADDSDQLKELDEIDRNNSADKEKKNFRTLRNKWIHDGGDAISAMMAAGGFSFAGRDAGGVTEKVASRKFCEENGLNLVVMQRINKMRMHLCKLAQMRLPNASGVAVETGTYLPSMPPPKRAQECLLRQVIASGLLDNVARRAPPGNLSPEFTGVPRSAYMCGNISLREPLFLDNNSSVHSKLPEWVCFDSVVRKKRKDGTTVVTMQRVTPIDVDFLATLCHGSNMLFLGTPLATPVPRYNKETDSIQCAIETKFGTHSWQIPPLYVDMYDVIKNESQSASKKQNPAVVEGDSFRWFARFLLEGKVLPELSDLLQYLNDEPSIITRRKPHKKVTLLLSALSSAGVDNARALQKHWTETSDKFLFRELKPWVKNDCASAVKALWINAVTANIDVWKERSKLN